MRLRDVAVEDVDCFAGKDALDGDEAVSVEQGGDTEGDELRGGEQRGEKTAVGEVDGFWEAGAAG